MEHKAKEFLFKHSNKDAICKTKKYCFAIEEILIKRVTKEKYDFYQLTGKLDFEMTHEAVKEDFPKLLDCSEVDVAKINWFEQDYDTIQDVYFFFLRYKKNAALNRLASEKETLLSNLENLQNLIDSLPENLLKKLNFNTMNDK